MTKDDFAKHMTNVMSDLVNLRQAGHKEYAGGEDAFGNFNRLATKLGLDRKKVLLVYYAKHEDGVVSYLNGHISQRESVHGRIRDMIVYLMLLDGMIAEEESEDKTEISPIQVLADRRRDFDPNKESIDPQYRAGYSDTHQ